MDKVYKMSEYAKRTLEELGYEVKTDTDGTMRECFQGVRTLVDKSNGKALYSCRENLLELSDEEWESGIAQLLNGTPTDIYKGIHSERIELSKYGETDIIFDNGTKIHFPNHNENSKTMEIVLYDSTGKRLNITYYGINYDYPQYTRKNSIRVSAGVHEDMIAHIEEHRTEWSDYEKRFKIKECSPSKVTKQIVSRIKAYENGKYWNPEFKQGLEVIAPAIALMVLEFKKGWLEQIDEYVSKEEKDQKKAKQSIDALIEQIANSEIRVVELVRAQDELTRNIQAKQFQKKRTTTQQENMQTREI